MIKTYFPINSYEQKKIKGREREREIWEGGRDK